MKGAHRRKAARLNAPSRSATGTVDLGISLSVYGKSSDGALVEIRDSGDGEHRLLPQAAPSAAPTRH